MVASRLPCLASWTVPMQNTNTIESFSADLQSGLREISRQGFVSDFIIPSLVNLLTRHGHYCIDISNVPRNGQAILISRARGFNICRLSSIRVPFKNATRKTPSVSTVSVKFRRVDKSLGSVELFLNYPTMRRWSRKTDETQGLY